MDYKDKWNRIKIGIDSQSNYLEEELIATVNCVDISKNVPGEKIYDSDEENFKLLQRFVDNVIIERNNVISKCYNLLDEYTDHLVKTYSKADKVKKINNRGKVYRRIYHLENMSKITINEPYDKVIDIIDQHLRKIRNTKSHKTSDLKAHDNVIEQIIREKSFANELYQLFNECEQEKSIYIDAIENVYEFLETSISK